MVLSGGLTHDFPATTACLTAELDAVGLTVEVHTDVDDALLALEGSALLVVNALRWTMTNAGVPERYRMQAGTEGASPSSGARAAFDAHLAAGGGLLAMHTAPICFDDWPEWADALGARWVWGHSQHPPLGPPVDVEVCGEHEIVDGVDGFTLVDEVYGDLEFTAAVTPLVQAAQPTDDHRVMPLLWAREHGGGRVVVDLLGHHPPSYAVEEHTEIVRRAIRWTGRA
ncbi:ThuA domain-containing protein [Actinomycetospora soli]|uniref:ThuA domain-containing protein n=1 Tax=Actinomycetospora soli TaxID=2893887 RepID=UPI001E5D3B3E|nr:ThuA domain-containing protein [Actinomycetospora soli]MCD2187898.1 ThuA domain-containing protein [Actinomycetospora soli]